MRLKSDYKSIIQDKDFASYELDNFVYQIDNDNNNYNKIR